MPSRPPNEFVTTTQGMMRQSGETLFSAVCMFIRRCHTKRLFSVRFPYSSLFPIGHIRMYNLQIIRLIRLLKLEKTKKKGNSQFHGASSFILWLLGCHLATNMCTFCSLHTISAHRSVVYITMGVLPNLKRLTSNIFKVPMS